eukprot:TRINITY_DN2966_c0_g2_i6.p1 TRINITY_DN2966_c0_g2~~TRINITY_DN2966_c0_g2_i6.p1  ORF type:complete len:155 (-),score=32.72 TRINITY_DN2966_c0_g2_i6:40-504(-)
MEFNHSSVVWCVELSETELKKSNSININKVFANWQAENPETQIAVPPALKKGQGQVQSDSTSVVPNGNSDSRLNPKGKEFFQKRVAEIEDRILYSGMVDNEGELDLEDSFIDNSPCKERESHVLVPANILAREIEGSVCAVSYTHLTLPTICSV